ncbi:MAG: 23S rRNA (pseudouridine(1915)-N(3))-methyltransferase RlmH [Pseudomonadota bacterium]|jgi:Uncharacterized conserved protein|nr:MAG: 23S rRNA (pseudouridine(1915)-N(3))-methyltransferase RlmH [Pseudomonadota bacterium]
MRLAIAAVGRLKAGPERTLIERYQERIGAGARALGFSALDIAEVAESRARREEDRRREEGAALLQRIGDSIAVAFDERGRALDSQTFANILARWRDEGAASLTCVIGGADGLAPEVRERARLVLSFGAMTLPHQLVRVLVAEQLYRAMTILAGHPYHRE